MIDLPKNFMALDLELNNAEDNSTPNPKIIQVGIAIGNITQEPKDYFRAKWFINPHEPIFSFITKLTGITDKNVQDESVTHQQVAEELAEIMEAKQVFSHVITWGNDDLSALLKEFKENHIEFKYYRNQFIDISSLNIFLLLSKGKKSFGGLRSTMSEFKLKFEGEQHRADVDAFNTLVLFFEMIKRQKQLEDILTIAKDVKR